MLRFHHQGTISNTVSQQGSRIPIGMVMTGILGKERTGYELQRSKISKKPKFVPKIPAHFSPGIKEKLRPYIFDAKLLILE